MFGFFGNGLTSVSLLVLCGVGTVFGGGDYCSDFDKCPDRCDYSVKNYGEGCDCSYPYGMDADENCKVCHSPASEDGPGPGCDQCDIENDYFKIDYDYPCLQCQEVFGDKCLHCSDYDGCQQCADGCERVFDDSCDVYHCECPCDEDHDSREPVTTQWWTVTPKPTEWPTNKPTQWPTNKPTDWPTNKPTEWPTNKPTHKPTDRPTEWPTSKPTNKPTEWPTNKPTDHPTNKPTEWPTNKPTNWPTEWPTNKPTEWPTNKPTNKPTDRPTNKPTEWPTNKPTDWPTNKPTEWPTSKPTNKPTEWPTNKPTDWPTNKPTEWPTMRPTEWPTSEPTELPTQWPTNYPTDRPTNKPTDWPTNKPTEWPTNKPTEWPTNKPTEWPTNKPTERPTEWPTNKRTEWPTNKPTEWPTNKPTEWPTNKPTEWPTNKPTEWPTMKPTNKPTDRPTKKPTEWPTNKPTEWPTSKPTNKPTDRPTNKPTDKPTQWPTSKPTNKPTAKPTWWTTEPPEDCTGIGGGISEGETCHDGSVATWDVASFSQCETLYAKSDYYWYDAGKVCVNKVDKDTVEISYSTKNGWYLNQVHAWLGGDKDGYPQYDGSYDNYPKLSEFPFQNEGCSYYQTEETFTVDIRSLDDCEYFSFCDNCDGNSDSLLYIVAQAKVKYYGSSGAWSKTAYRNGEYVFDYGYYWALRGEVTLETECCD